MPQIANITVKKNDGTTDVIYTAIVPSAGDKSPAVWRNNTVGTAPGHRPEFQCASQFNGPRSARRIVSKLTYPTLVTGSDGRVSVADKCIIEVNGLVPQGMLDVDIAEAVSQAFNLMASTLMKDTYKSGHAPT